jgi:hypothetical protein
MTIKLTMPITISDSPEPEVVGLRIPDEVVLSDCLSGQPLPPPGWAPNHFEGSMMGADW